MVFLELAVIANWKRIKRNRFVKPVIDIAIQLDPDRTLKKLRRR